jgi:hypothetical protein
MARQWYLARNGLGGSHVRASCGFRTTGAGSTTLPIASIFATAGCRPRVREIGVFNTTATAVAIAVRRMTAVGTAGTGQTEVYNDDDAQTILATVFDTHTVTGTFVTGSIRAASLGAAIGSGIIWTFADPGLIIPAGTGNGVVVVPLTGTGQICDVYFEWEE